MRIIIRQGLRFPGPGEPWPVVTPEVSSVAVHGDDCRGLRPEILVARGDRVAAGQALFRDRHQPEIQVVTPAAGVVSEVRIGPRRALLAIVVDTRGPPADPVGHCEPAGGIEAISTLSLNELRRRLQAAGLWVALRARPGDRVPPADGMADALFVTAMDTAPWAPPAEALLEGRWEAFRAGVAALSRLSRGTTWVCAAPGFPLEDDVERGIRLAEFDGPHPAGLPGTHIHRLAPLQPGRSAWHIGCQDVAVIGQLLLSGTLELTRRVGLGGPGVTEPVLMRVPLGANAMDCTTDLPRGRAPFARDIVCGSLLSGRRAEPPFEHLGRFHRQVSVTSNMPPGRGTPRLLARMLAEEAPGNLPRVAARGMLPGDRLDALWALDCPPAPLLRALLTGDLEAAVALGCLDLGEEDLALPALACADGHDYGACLRDALDACEREQSR